MEHTETARYYKQNLFQQLRGFYHVAVTRSFTAAAQRMFLEQPTVSLQVRALERELRTGLFERKRGGVILTTEGEVLFELAAPVVEAVESLLDAFYERLGRLEVGKVVCSAPESVVMHVLPEVIPAFKARFPNVDLVLLSSASPYTVQMVLRGEADLGVVAPVRLPPNISFQPLVSYDNYLVMPLGHPLAGQPQMSLDEVVKYPVLAPLQQSRLWQNFCQALERQGLACQMAMQVESAEVRLQYVESGMGVTIVVGASLLSKRPRNFTWVSLGDALPETTFGLVTRKSTYLSLPAKRFVEFLLSADLPTFGAAPEAPSQEQGV